MTWKQNILEVTSMVITYWIVAFLRSGVYIFIIGYSGISRAKCLYFIELEVNKATLIWYVGVNYNKFTNNNE